MGEYLNKSIALRSRCGDRPDGEPDAAAQGPAEEAAGNGLNGAQKKELLENWAWRIVHELRNSLQVISGHGEMLCPTMGEDELRWHKQEIQKAVSHAAEMAQRLQVLAESGLQRSKNGDAGGVNLGGTDPQTTSSSEFLCCQNTCRLLSSPDRTVFWRKLPSLRGPFSVEFLEHSCLAGVGKIREARQCPRQIS